MTGVVGGVVLSFIGFLGIYAVMTAMRADRLAISERVMTALFYSAGVLLLGALAFVVFFTLVRGSSALST